MDHPQLSEAEAKRLIRRGVQLIGEHRRAQAKAAELIERRTAILRALVDGGVPTAQVADAWGISRQNLDRQLQRR